jgi:hypothetical protein
MSIQLFFSSMTTWGERTGKKKHSTMQPATKKARTIRFTEQKTPFVFVFSVAVNVMRFYRVFIRFLVLIGCRNMRTVATKKNHPRNASHAGKSCH